MADLNAIDAAAAYGRALNQAVKGDGPGGVAAGDGASFKAALSDIIGGVADAAAASETVSMEAVAGKADLVDVVTAVTNAEMVVETVVAVRDRVIQAYNDIIRMPI
ncbi:MAG: flagellar hook-basal body complex protein FliE [Proteobacteria bacterium]|nr:flagellar hook-basal body complex protein FliE [Pseudomonadota bacterium]